LHGELDFVTLGFQRAEGELCGGDVESVEGEFVAGVMLVEGLRGVDEPDPMQLSVSRLGHWGWGAATLFLWLRLLWSGYLPSG
jgi:hypothetical protein